MAKPMPVVTVILWGPGASPGGTLTLIWLGSGLAMLTLMSSKLTLTGGGSRWVPVMVISSPAAPVLGMKRFPVNAGPSPTVKFPLLTAVSTGVVTEIGRDPEAAA